MARIREQKDRHFIDECGQMFWINGPENSCYLSEQRQWRSGLSFLEVLEWKQCAPTGLISQRFGSILEACQAFEQNRITWTNDVYLRHMGEQMEIHRSLQNYRPTYIKLAESRGAPIRTPPWIKPEDSYSYSFPGPRCIWPGPAKQNFEKIHQNQHTHRRVRGVKNSVR